MRTIIFKKLKDYSGKYRNGTAKFSVIVKDNKRIICKEDFSSLEALDKTYGKSFLNMLKVVFNEWIKTIDMSEYNG